MKMVSSSVIVRMTLAGTPAAKELSGIDLVTTLPAPITRDKEKTQGFLDDFYCLLLQVNL